MRPLPGCLILTPPSYLILNLPILGNQGGNNLAGSEFGTTPVPSLPVVLRIYNLSTSGSPSVRSQLLSFLPQYVRQGALLIAGPGAVVAPP